MSDRIGRFIKGNADRPIFGYNCPDNEIEPHSARLLRRGGDRDLYGISQCISGSNNVTNTFKGQLVKKSDKGVYYVENPCCSSGYSSGSGCPSFCKCLGDDCKPRTYYMTIQIYPISGPLNLLNGVTLKLDWLDRSGYYDWAPFVTDDQLNYRWATGVLYPLDPSLGYVPVTQTAYRESFGGLFTASVGATLSCSGNYGAPLPYQRPRVNIDVNFVAGGPSYGGTNNWFNNNPNTDSFIYNYPDDSNPISIAWWCKSATPFTLGPRTFCWLTSGGANTCSTVLLHFSP